METPKVYKIDPGKFKIERVYWYGGDAHTLPGYQIMIKTEGQDKLSGVQILSNEVNKDWIIS